MFTRNNNILIISLLSNSIKVFSGPLILLVISNKLSIDEQALYFVFFSLMAIRQLLESGAGVIFKQFIAHEYLKINNHVKVKSYVNFSFAYFFILSLTIFLILLFFGTIFISSKGIDIDWHVSWYLLLVVNFISIALVPYLLMLDAFQKQMHLQTIQFVSSVSYSLSLITLIYLNLGLISIAISMFISNIILYSFVYFKFKKDFSSFLQFDNIVKNFKKCFLLSYGLLAKAFFSFFSVFAFWNLVPLICFYIMPVDYSAPFNLTWALLRSGFYIAQVINSSQATIYTKLFTNISSCYNRFIQVSIFCSICLVLGYLLLFFLKLFNLGAFSGVINISELKYLIVCSFLLYPFVALSDFSRVFKEELYVKNLAYISFSTSLLLVVFFLNGKNEIFYIIFINYTIALMCIYIKAKDKFNEIKNTQNIN